MDSIEMENLIESKLINKNDSSLLTKSQIINEYGSLCSFMKNFNLKPSDDKDIDNAILLSKSFKDTILESENDDTKSTKSSLKIDDKDSYPFRLLVLFSVYGIDLDDDEFFKTSGITNDNDINQCESKLISYLLNKFYGQMNFYNFNIGKLLIDNDKSCHIDSNISNLNSIVWLATRNGKKKLEFYKPRKQSGTCIFYQLVGSDRFLECKVYYDKSIEDTNNIIKLLCENGISFGGRNYYFLCGEQPKNKNKNEKDKNYFKCQLYSYTDWQQYTLDATDNKLIYKYTSKYSNMSDSTIRICNLGSSNSMLNQSVDQLIDAFADFKSYDKIKRNSRLLLGFSCCKSFILCEEHHITIIKDIKSSEGNIMTDGCGLISSSYFEDISLIPIVIQIRAISSQGLFKGDLIVTSNESICKRGEIKMRESMKKANGSTYRSNDQKVTIFIKNTFQYDKFHWGYTNHELMLLLLHGGVPGDVFMDLLQKEMENIPAISVNNTPKDINDLLRNLRRLRDYSNYDDNNNNNNNDSDDGSSTVSSSIDKGYIDNVQKLIDLLECRHDPSKEIYLKFLLEKIQISQLKKLVSLKVPFYNQDADIYTTNVVGCPDPLGILEENEVYVSMNFKITNRGSGSIKDGDVIVSRYPMGHPGDIRKMKIKTYRELDEFVGDRKGGVIFFSIKGRRSAADMMGGGDFDGDTFLIIYGENVVVQSFKESKAYMYGSTERSTELLPESPKNQSYKDVVRSLTRPSVLGEFANKRKACKI